MHAAESEPRHRAEHHEHHRGRAHDPRHEHDAARHPQRDAHQGGSTGDAAPALSVREVTLEYPDGTANDGTPRTVRALDRVSLELQRGEMTALIGPSGSGKSSLLAVAAALIKPTSGTVMVAGESLTELPEKELARIRRGHTGMVFQQPNLLAALTSREQLVLSAHVAGARGKELKAARTRADELLEQVGLVDCGDRRPHQLSGGQRQRVNIARALMNDPQLLLVDEPTAALDQERSKAIMELLANLTHQFRLASLVVTHDTEFVPLADRCVTMEDGRLQ
ncbi:ABC transporter ATP-binding protein [Kocuria rhizophila]|uniref:ABC transporter ATP-binding protein n=1 Tax=Kocuria rhizophila TaxID=72000 RepID=UPI001EF68A3E|nr:ABC transporter ATP-binding protein [Kocuria rhizophila]MCG7425257.1 ABC transporter ATP-binding protein [Kocuria rhizophila]MCT1456800.1 ABC transporter ATP-binding protein [Kocuria rhizophila]